MPSDAHPIRVFRNPGSANHWISVKLRGVKTNRSAIGAKVKVVIENRNHTEQAFYRQVGSGGSWGASPLTQEIGLGKAERIKTIEIYWPASKTTQIVKNVPMDEFIEIEESQAAIYQARAAGIPPGCEEDAVQLASKPVSKRALGWLIGSLLAWSLSTGPLRIWRASAIRHLGSY